jgi:protein O-mannosyl-transferase
LTTLLWAVHPMQTESVIWLSGRFDVLVVFFAVLTLLVNHHPRRILFVPLTLALALLSKEIGIALFPAIIGADIVRLGGLRPALKTEGSKWLGISFVVGSYLLLRKALGIYGASDLLGGLAPSVFLSGLAELSITYARLTLLPIGLDVYHWYTARSVGIGAAILVAHFAVFAMAIAYSWKRKQGVIAAGCTLSLLSLMLSSNVGPSQGIYGDRFWSFTGLALVFVIAELLEQRPPISRLRLLPWAAAAAVFGLLTLLRGFEWKSEEHLAVAALEQDPQNRHWLLLSSHHLLRRGQLDSAHDSLARLIELEPRMAKAFNALCVVELRRNRLDDAERECLEATRLSPENPSTWVNLASVYVNGRKYDETRKAAEKALSIQPKNVEAEYLLAIVEANLGAFDEARKHMERGLSYSPRHPGLRKLEAQLAQQPGTLP